MRFDWGRRHAGAPVTTDFMFHSFLDLCGIKSDKLIPAKSLFNSRLEIPSAWRVEDYQGQWHDLAEVPDSVH